MPSTAGCARRWRARKPPASEGGRVAGARSAVRLIVTGRVQGVGFRPTVYRLARSLGLAGTVCNSSRGVRIELEGPAALLERFQRELPSAVPSLARVETIEVEPAEATGRAGFAILPSEQAGSARALIPYDVATCDACLAEFADPEDRRHRYPFINCTLCGPRYTIIESVPYDRARTSMKRFRLCPRCQAEYDDPADRRYHAQPNACPVCGPSLELVDAAGRPVGGDPIARARAVLQRGEVLAIRGLGGFHLAVDARNAPAVERLRARKRRGPKPFAVMCPDPQGVERIAELPPSARRLLLSERRPIVLLDRAAGYDLAEAVAPGNPRVGVMLPYTPLHLLLVEGFRALVMTSGNLAEEPIAKDNREALVRLGGLADAFLLHDRDILMSCDDSVCFVDAGGAPAFVRRSRGYAPDPVPLPGAPDGILAVGGEMKNTFCLTRDGQAFLSQHVGDLGNLETSEHFARCLSHMQRLLGVAPRVVACDMHPDYETSRFARELEGVEIVRVQHHHAHLASALADSGQRGEVLGLCLDGTGYGEDGTIWGGELLLGSDAGYRRLARLRPFRLPGGDAAVRHPWRSLVGVLLEHGGAQAAVETAGRIAGVGVQRAEAVARAAERGVNAPWTSSLGRLFDAVSALLSICSRVDYDGQAAVELEAQASAAGAQPAGPSALRIVPGRGELDFELDYGPLLDELLAGLARGVEAPVLAAGFHAAVAAGFAEACRRAHEAGGPDRVVLSGGCLMNRLLDRQLGQGLEAAGLNVLRHRQVPANDGGLCLGQAAVAAAHMRHGGAE
ncbi:MAG: carbamoyltransferase HypF [Deltaproteobacteria bacterium]|nr:carbamoyltransferase HypF [Deltaproteobacteria bacterium]